MKTTVKDAHKMAREAYSVGDLINAESLCNQVLTANPDHFETKLLLGMVKFDRGHTAKARIILAALHTDHPDNIDVLYLLAMTEQQLKQYQNALDHYKVVIDQEPKHANAQYMYVLMLESLNELDAAEQHLKTLPGNEPPFIYLMATIKRRQKKYDEAIELLQGIGRDHPEPLMVQIYFELAKCLDKTGAYDEAYETTQKAHALSIALNERHKRKTGKDFFIKELELFEKIFNTPDNKNPVKSQPANIHFLVGFPRSGTTLLTQMLDAHPEIEVIDEFPFLRRTYNKAIRMIDGKPMTFNTDLDADKIKELQNIYMQSLQAYVREYTDDDDISADKIYIDKMPLSMVLSGFAHKLFPEAKFILSLRHPCDCTISNFMQHYDSNAAMENMRDLGDIVNLYTKCFDLFLGTTETLKKDVHKIRYEDLIKNFESETAAICEFLGIDNAPEIKNYRDNVLNKGISTPSYQQVTEPLYKTSKQRWLNYKKYFEPHLDDLKPYIKKFGYKDK